MTLPADPSPHTGAPASAAVRKAGLPFIAITICLDVVSHTMVFPVLPNEALSEQAGGKKYRSSVLVRVVEPG